MSNLFKRISDVVTANINDLIDRVEDPERMIKQIIREMEENITQAKEGVVDAVASEKKLEREVSQHKRESQEWEGKAEAALRAGKEDLARSALVRKNEHDKVLKSLEPAWESAVNTCAGLKAQLRALDAKLDEAKRKRSSLVARQRATEAQQHMERSSAAFQDGLKAHSEFERMEDKVVEMEARTQAMSELNADTSGVEREFRDMALDAEVDAELAALRKKIES